MVGGAKGEANVDELGWKVNGEIGILNVGRRWTAQLLSLI